MTASHRLLYLLNKSYTSKLKIWPHLPTRPPLRSKQRPIRSNEPLRLSPPSSLQPELGCNRTVEDRHSTFARRITLVQYQSPGCSPCSGSTAERGRRFGSICIQTLLSCATQDAKAEGRKTKLDMLDNDYGRQFRLDRGAPNSRHRCPNLDGERGRESETEWGEGTRHA